MFSLIAAAVLAFSLSEGGTSTATACDRPEAARLNPLAAKLSADSSAVDSKLEEVYRLLEEGETRSARADDAAAAESFRCALALLEELPAVDPNLQGEALYGLGTAYFYLGDADAALPVLEAALALYQALSDPGLSDREPSSDRRQTPAAETAYADILTHLFEALGAIHHERAHYATALGYYRQGLTTDRPDLRAILLHNIGAVESEIGQYAEATATLQQAASLSQQTQQVGLEASTIFTLGWVAERQGNLEQAIAQYRAAIELFGRADEPSRETRTLNNLGMAYLKQGNLSAAQSTFDRGFVLLTLRDDPYERSILLDSLGALQQASGEFDRAWKTHRQALQLSQQIGDTQGEIEILLNLGRLMELQSQADVAIFFYKQAVEKIETIRQDLRQLSQSVQQRYTLTIEDFYRNLADLLLQQSRFGEALQVLELLKLQEIKAYLHENRTEDRAASPKNGLSTPSEIALAEVLMSLHEDTPLASFIQHPSAIALSTRRLPADDLSFDLNSIEGLAEALSAQPKTAALYPLILKDRLEIILITPDGVIEHRAVPVTQAKLRETIAALQKNLNTRVIDPTPAAQQLYQWLIEPVEEVLSDRAIENIIYLPDGPLRYVPLAALHDGQVWLAEKYPSHNITAAAIGNLTEPRSPAARVLAGAFTSDIPAHQVEVGEQSFVFSGLLAARQEIDNLARLMPQTTTLLDRDFTPEKTLDLAGDRQIVHLATHAKFVPGQPEDSFVLFGDGSTVNLREIGQWKLPNADLVVFSACQTAASATGEGKEILGLGFQVQQTGASAAIASLWAVDDAATAALMTQFYTALSDGMTKAQALRYAQQKLIDSDSFSHPYHWAAFILIGNGL